MPKIQIVKANGSTIIIVPLFKWSLEYLKTDKIRFFQLGRRYLLISEKGRLPPKNFLSANWKTSWRRGRIRYGHSRNPLNLKKLMESGHALRTRESVHGSRGLLDVGSGEPLR